MNAMTDTPSREQIVESLNSLPENTLWGRVATWDVDTPALHIDKVRAALKSAGLDQDLARDMDNRDAFARAKNALKENRAIDKVRETKDGFITFQLTHKEIVDQGGRPFMKHELECMVTLDTNTGDIKSGNAEIESAAKKLFAHAREHRTSSDISRLVQKMFKGSADLFSLNLRKGVVYFVPERHADFTKKVAKFLAGVGGYLELLPVPRGDEHGDAAVRNSLTNGMTALLEELDESIGEWTETTRQATMRRGMDKYQTAKFKIECYADLLGDQQQRALDHLEKTKDALLEKMGQVRAAKAAKS